MGFKTLLAIKSKAINISKNGGTRTTHPPKSHLYKSNEKTDTKKRVRIDFTRTLENKQRFAALRGDLFKRNG